MKEKCKKLLSRLTKKKHILLTKSGNAAIMLCLKLARSKKIKNLLVPDQGGWITYRQHAKKLGFIINELKTDSGLVDNLGEHSNCALIVNSMPAYSFLQGMKGIQDQCREKNIFLINDISASIGTQESTYGDIILGSFGKWKPVNLGQGGFVAADMPLGYEDAQLDCTRLFEKLKNLQKRVEYLNKINQKIKSELRNFRVIHREKPGINVIVGFESETEKNKILGYCEKHKYPYTLCPRYIRIMDKAVCIEVKRL